MAKATKKKAKAKKKVYNTMYIGVCSYGQSLADLISGNVCANAHPTVDNAIKEAKEQIVECGEAEAVVLEIRIVGKCVAPKIESVEYVEVK